MIQEYDGVGPPDQGSSFPSFCQEERDSLLYFRSSGLASMFENTPSRLVFSFLDLTVEEDIESLCPGRQEGRVASTSLMSSP